MRTLYKLPVALLLAGALTGCATWHWHWPAWMRGTRTSENAEPAMPPDSVAGILYFTGDVLALPQAKQKQAYESARKHYKNGRSAADRMRLALLAALLPEPMHDAARARSLLTGYSWTTTQPGYAGLAKVTLHILAVQRESDHELARTRTKLADAQQQSAHLKSQLDALKAIEKSLGERRRGGDGH
ncbi:MAG TPA: hypothetical protein VFK96_10460 [Gammaproteobacteria bacterium]|nr:hypothetical protein [Gammaproteobacteria bacterium]